VRSDPLRTLSGRDLLAGGTWLAVNQRGVVAGLTNKPLLEGRDPARRSRGSIPLDLTACHGAAAAVAAFQSSTLPQEFNPCWALAGDRTSLYSLDLTGADRVVGVELPPGVHVLENKALGEPSAKVDHVKEAIGDLRGRAIDDVALVLRDVLRDHTETQPAAGDTAEARRRAQISACCVHSDDYGTRSSMVIRVPRAPLADPEVWASNGPSCTTPLVPAVFGG
jgi:uncharacterized protein with NRDE domain